MYADEQTVALLRDYFASREDVLLAYLFGSQAEGRATAGRSDYDIAVYFKPASGRFEYEENDCEYSVESEINRELEALTGTEVDLIVLNRAAASIVFSAINGTIKLAEKDHDLAMSLLLRSSADAEEYRELVSDYYAIASRSQSLNPNDALRLQKILIFAEPELVDLQAYGAIDQRTFERDVAKRRVLERSVEILMNAGIDVAKVLLASRKRKVPEKYADVMRHLAYLDNFPQETATWLGDAARTRNFLAHEYLDLEYRRVQQFVSGSQEHLGALFMYAKAVVAKEGGGNEAA